MKALIHGREIKRIIEEAWYPDAYYKVEVEPIEEEEDELATIADVRRIAKEVLKKYAKTFKDLADK